MYDDEYASPNKKFCGNIQQVVDVAATGMYEDEDAMVNIINFILW